MINCPKCKAEIEPDSLFCDQCGQEIFFCRSCGRVGKGRRCTVCGGEMAKYNTIHDELNTNTSVTNREALEATMKRAAVVEGIEPIILVNNNLSLRLPAVDGCVLGRRNGIYQEQLSQCRYISGTHAQLMYDHEGQRWLIIDRGASNGTKLNGVKLVPDIPSHIRPGDKLMLANIEFRIEKQ